MFRFEHSEYLYALLLIPVLIGFFVLMWRFRKRAIERFGEAKLVQQLMSNFSPNKHIVKFTLLMLAFTFLVVGWANPQWGSKRQKVKRKSADIFIALDISYSMLAEDVPPSRMYRARQFAEDLIYQLRGERLGLIVFAGNAYLETPLTDDYAFITLESRSANPFQAPTQGTAIGEAIDLAERSFDEENQNHKALIVITDGENHDEEAIERAEAAQRNGLIVFTVGVGTQGGGFIPISMNGRTDFKRDETGNPVRTQLNEAALQAISNVANGNYFNLAAGADEVIEALQQRIDQMEKREFEQRVFDEYESYFQYFLGIGLLFLIIEYLISYRKNKLVEGRDLFGA